MKNFSFIHVTIAGEISSCSKALSAEHKSKIYIPSQATGTGNGDVSISKKNS
jgi:hypothetical protein